MRTIGTKLTGPTMFAKTSLLRELLFAEHVQYMRAMTAIKAPDLTDEQKSDIAADWARSREVISAHVDMHVLMQQELQERGVDLSRLLEKYREPLSESAAMMQSAIMAQAAKDQQNA